MRLNLKRLYSSPKRAFIFGVIIVGLLIPSAYFVVSTLWGPDIYNISKGNVGLKVSPEEIIYSCNTTDIAKGIIKTITLTNYDSQTKENILLSIGYPLSKPIYVNLTDLDKVIGGPFDLIVVESNGYSYQIYPIPSLKSQGIALFDLELLSENCSEQIPVTISIDNEPISSLGRIFG